jgi:phospholipase/carboxylesterase
MVAVLDGPRIAPRSGTTRQLVVFLHGYGADGSDLIEIGRQWQALLPDAAFVSPHAPERCAMSPSGRQWFPLTMRDPSERWRGVQAARPVLDHFLDQELARHNLDESRLALVGFSQGTMMALHVGLAHPRRLAAIVGYSGMLVLPDNPQEQVTIHAGPQPPPPVLLVHGDRDEVIPVGALFMAAADLAEANVPCQWHLSAGTGHGIDAGGLRHGGLALAAAFGQRTPAAQAGARTAL